MMRRLCTFAFLILAASARPALGCSCMPVGPACQAYWNTDAVFDATVLDTQPLPRDETHPFLSDTLVTLNVRQSWKGASAGPLEVATSRESSACGYEFKKGARYVVFARKRPDGRLQVSHCSATQPYDGTGPVAEFLASLSGPPAGGRVFGTVRTFVRTFGAEAKTSESPTVTGVQIRGVGVERSTQSAGGRYQFVNLAAGSYSVSIAAPDGYAAVIPVRQTDIADSRGCAEENFEFSPAGSITGRLVGPDGHGVARIRVEVTSPEIRRQPAYGYESASAYADSDGYFTAGSLAPGRYIVGIDLNDLPNEYNPYPRTLYPGGPDADVLTLSLGQSIDLGTWRLPVPLEVVPLPGVVTWSDGSPAAGVTVFMQDRTGNAGDGARGAGFATSDVNGRFVLKARRSRVYTFQVRTSGPAGVNSLPISAVTVTIDSGTPEPVRLVIRAPRPQ